MAIEPQYCANEVCIKHTERRGGKFRYNSHNGKTYCEDCFRPEVQFDGAKELYEFSTTHLTGERIHVRGKAHLRELERKHGVSHQQLNNYERSWAN